MTKARTGRKLRTRIVVNVECRECEGEGKTGDGRRCGHCLGRGWLGDTCTPAELRAILAES